MVDLLSGSAWTTESNSVCQCVCCHHGCPLERPAHSICGKPRLHTPAFLPGVGPLWPTLCPRVRAPPSLQRRRSASVRLHLASAPRKLEKPRPIHCAGAAAGDGRCSRGGRSLPERRAACHQSVLLHAGRLLLGTPAPTATALDQRYHPGLSPYLPGARH